MRRPKETEGTFLTRQKIWYNSIWIFTKSGVYSYLLTKAKQHVPQKSNLSICEQIVYHILFPNTQTYINCLMIGKIKTVKLRTQVKNKQGINRLKLKTTSILNDEKDLCVFFPGYT